MSTARKRLVVVHGPEGSLGDALYFVRLLLPAWEERGWSITVVEDPRRFVPADLALAHIDATVVPERWLELLGRYRRVINGGLVDISKRRVSDPVLFDLDGWEGPVIVKTDRNCFGVPERVALTMAMGRGVRYLRYAAWHALRALDRFRDLDPRELYPVFPSLREVPSRLRRNPELVIQRFVPERDGELYALRTCAWLGSRGVTAKARSTEPVVKARGAVDSQLVDTPEGLIARVRPLGADYGKIDFTLVNGEPVVFDLNRTPTYSGPEPKPRHVEMVREIAPAIDEFLD